MKYKFIGFKTIHWDGIENLPHNILKENSRVTTHVTGDLGGHKNSIIGLTLEWKVRMKLDVQQLLSGIFESQYLLNLNDNNDNIIEELKGVVQDSFMRSKQMWDTLIEGSVIHELVLPHLGPNDVDLNKAIEIRAYLLQHGLIT